ncbi:bulb-type lectin domain-containing protein [Streptomyces sp. NBC_01431]|uniref:bulb-type lectin domain-containing protein n=1 Tax=Streptomyces sp. NBC_01431 TaxID=2903863 RepID=UPI003FCCBD49
MDGSVGGRRITPGTRLTSGQSITSNSAKLTMQADGNLTITSNANKVIWSTNTSGNAGATALIQSDGNITVNKPGDDSTSLWSTNQATSSAWSGWCGVGDVAVTGGAGAGPGCEE